MDLSNPPTDGDESVTEESPRQRQLPADLPRSLDDRQPVQSFGGETEMYDAWQGESRFLTTPTPAQPLGFNLSLDDRDFESDNLTQQRLEDNDARLMEMLAAQAAHREEGAAEADEDSIVTSKDLSEEDKKSILQKSLHNAASNGDVERIRRILRGKSKGYIDINAPDEEGTAPIIYASCFGHLEVVTALLNAGADINRQDRRNQWTSLMWAMTNRHKDIAKTLLDHGASPDIKSSSGRTASDFAPPNSEISDFLQKNGYHIGDTSIGEDFYDNGFSQDKFEQEMEENEMKRRMMMESSINLEVDLSSLVMDEHPETPDDLEEQQEFVWDRCLNDQMFVFQENELNRILDIIITEMTPQRSASQKPVPANILFLAARYAHYHARSELLTTLLVSAMDKINNKVERHQWDMTVLAFWISNATLLLHYLQKDTGLVGATTEFQVQLVELINEIFILIIRDAERRMERVLDAAILDFETIPFGDLEFAGEWNIFKSKNKNLAPEPISYKPPPPNKRTRPEPRNVTSLLSSTLFVLDLYDIHSVIIAQILAQLFYWIGAELFNHTLSDRKYLARTKAMQIRMNISVLEDWARANNRIPEHYESGSLSTSGENTIEAARKHFKPIVQLLQWLQCFSSLSDNANSLDSLENTLSQMTRLTAQQLLHSADYYRYEKDEVRLPKAARKRLANLATVSRKQAQQRHQKREPASPQPDQTPKTPKGSDNLAAEVSSPKGLGAEVQLGSSPADDEPAFEGFLMNPAHMLQFSLPTTVDMRLSYGAGYGGVNREREKKYIPTVPPEFLAKLDLGGSNGNFIEQKDWENEED